MTSALLKTHPTKLKKDANIIRQIFLHALSLDILDLFLKKE